MRTIGLIGGMSWESTASYYRVINEAVRDRMGGLHSARLVLHSVDFAEVAALQRADDWAGATHLLGDAGRGLAAAGAGVLVICTNTMHLVADGVAEAAGVPVLHIGDTTAGALKAAGHHTVGLLGTRFTMERPFYRERLQQHGLGVLVPDDAAMDDVHRIIFDELCVGEVRDASRARYREVMAGLVARGATAIVLGCTEISMLVGDGDASVPLFDTMRLHAMAAADWCMQDATA
jgi:aspartate racemase